VADIFELIAQGNIQDLLPSAENDSVDIQGSEDQMVEQPWYQSIPLDMVKGLLEGVSSLGRTMGPLRPMPGQEEITGEDFTESLDEILPTESNPVGSALRKGLKSAPSIIATPGGAAGSKLAKSIAGGATGEIAKQAGGGEVVQTIAEIVPHLFGGGKVDAKKGTAIRDYLSKSPLTPKWVKDMAGKSSASQKDLNRLIEFAESQGMTAEEIAPLIQGEAKKSLLSKVALKGGETQKALEKSKKAVGRISDTFRTGKYGKVVLEESASNKMMGKMQDILYDMPAKSRNAILEDFRQLASSPKDTDSIIKMVRNINAQYGEHKKHLGRLKGPLGDALATISPKLADEFNMTQKLFSKYYDISSKLKPTLASSIATYSKGPQIALGVATGNYSLILEAVGETAARKLASKMLTDPKFQDIGRKMINALNQGKYSIADRIKDQYIRALNEDHPEVTSKMQEKTFKQMYGEDL